MSMSEWIGGIVGFAGMAFGVGVIAWEMRR